MPMDGGIHLIAGYGAPQWVDATSRLGNPWSHPHRGFPQVGYGVGVLAGQTPSDDLWDRAHGELLAAVTNKQPVAMGQWCIKPLGSRALSIDHVVLVR